MATLQEWKDKTDKKRIAANKRLEYMKTDQKHWGTSSNRMVKNSPLWKIYHGKPIYPTEYRYLVNYFKYKGLTFSYPIEKIKFVNR